jgi:hypothetical protein
MKKVFSPAVIGIIVYLNCAPQIEFVPEFKDSNQMFVETTIKNVRIGGLVKKHVPAGSKVAVVSMETPSSVDLPIIAIIEDQLIFDVVNSGFVVLERDQHTVLNLFSENLNNGYTLVPSYPNQATNNVNMDDLITTTLATAKYLVSYRVLECGIRTSPSKNINFVVREGMVRLHVRIVDANTGKIIAMGTLTGNNNDQIKASFARTLANFHYTFYSHRYPVHNGAEDSDPAEPEKRSAPVPIKTSKWLLF